MMRSVSVIFDTGATCLCSSNKGNFVELKDKILPRNIKGMEKGVEISEFGIVEYSVRSKSRCIIALQDQAYYVPGLPNHFCIIYPRGICTSEGYNGTFIAHFRDEHDIFAELDFKEDNPGWKKVEPLNRFNLLPTWIVLLKIKLRKNIMLIPEMSYEGTIVSF